MLEEARQIVLKSIIVSSLDIKLNTELIFHNSCNVRSVSKATGMNTRNFTKLPRQKVFNILHC